MSTDRRSFLRTLANIVALATGGAVPAFAAVEDWDAHRGTRNSRWGTSGARWPRLSDPPLPFNPYPDAPRVALPPPTSDRTRPLAEAVRRQAAGAGFAAAPLTFAALGRLLHFANGVTDATQKQRGSGRLRAAPSAGALYAGEVYVVAERVRGLAPGSYYYDVRRHALARLAQGSLLPRAAQSLERPAAVENAAALVLLSNVFARYTFQYANRGYRYALIDTGHIGENLRLAAHSAGLRAELFPAFHDAALNELLGLDGRSEAVCALVAVGANASGAARPRQIVRRLVQRQQLLGFAPSSVRSVVARYHEASELVPIGEGRRPQPPPAFAANASAAPSCNAKALPVLAIPPAMPVERAIASRRSAERFTAGSMGLEQLAFALQVARGPSVPDRAAGLDLYLVANRIRNLAPGLYRYCSSVHGLEPRRSGALGRRLKRVCLGQEMAADAAAGFVVVAQLGEEGTVGRDRSYRDALIEAGVIAQRLYLAAEATGLSARNLAAFVDGDLNRLLGFDDKGAAAIHLTMLGPGA